MAERPRVSVIVPAGMGGLDAGGARDAIARYLETTGFTFEILLPPSPSYGVALRRGVADAAGDVLVAIDCDLPYPLRAIGDAVAMIDSGATDVVFATSDPRRHEALALTTLLVPILPDPSLRLKAFSSSAAKLVIAETKMAGQTADLEIAFLVNKYGFRVERLAVETSRGRSQRYGTLTALLAGLRIRMSDRRMAYRAARRCPVCFSPEVWTCAQIPGNVVRACKRCKCRYLNQFTEEDGSGPVRRVLPSNVPPPDVPEERHSETAREKTSARRLALLRKQLTARARVLEIGVREGSFGMAASREFEYVGIDSAPTVARHARSRGLEVYCATLSNFVNTGPAFDAVAVFHVLENMHDPHDALVRLKDLLKPGGTLFLTTFDTESLLYMITERKAMARNFRTHRRILYSRSALIELLEHSGFEIDAIGPEFEYRDHKVLRHVLGSRWPLLAPLARALLNVLPDPLLVGSGSIRIVAKRRAGTPLNVRAIRSVEPTHAR
jgi:2-polyprenyl-3-methyl-5-hydroxy-6-metoxy-1,4-benzoquinol methylase